MTRNAPIARAVGAQSVKVQNQSPQISLAAVRCVWLLLKPYRRFLPESSPLPSPAS